MSTNRCTTRAIAGTSKQPERAPRGAERGAEGSGKGDEGKPSTPRLFPATAGWGMAAAICGRPNLKWQRRPGRIPSSTGSLGRHHRAGEWMGQAGPKRRPQPPIAYSQRMET